MSDRMSRPQVLEIITAARAKGERPDLSNLNLSNLDLSGLDLSNVNLGGSNLAHSYLTNTILRHANLAYSNLHCAIMRHANLAYSNLHCAIMRHADLAYANLYNATLVGANLSDAIMRHTNIYRTDLRGADLRGVAMTALFLDGLPSGDLAFIPTPEGWSLIIGCWTGTTAELRAMIAGNEGWPEAEGEEIAVRRPMLTAAADMCEAYAKANPDALAEVKSAADRWKKNNN